jgi:hypothetical protein
MHMKLGEVELIKREDKNGAVKEIRSVHLLSVYGRRSIVEHSIPGSDANVFQDMGRNPSVISFEGSLIGPNAEDAFKEIKAKFELSKPVPFSSDIALLSDINSVVLEKLAVHLIGGINLGVSYSITLREQKSTNTKGARGATKEAKPPSQEDQAKKQIQQKINKEFGQVSH